MTDDPTIAAVLDQLRHVSGEDWSVTGAYTLSKGCESVLFGSRAEVLNYMLAYIGGIQSAWRDFTIRCPAMGWA